MVRAGVGDIHLIDNLFCFFGNREIHKRCCGRIGFVFSKQENGPAQAIAPISDGLFRRLNVIDAQECHTNAIGDRIKRDAKWMHLNLSGRPSFNRVEGNRLSTSLIARALVDLLRAIHDFVGNWGLAIILLTIAVRVLLLPLSIKQTRSQREMQRIMPEIKAIQKKHKGDRQKINEATMALYKEHGVNPLGGCLPLLMQFPILIALYYVIRFPTKYMGWAEDSKLAALLSGPADVFEKVNGPVLAVERVPRDEISAREERIAELERDTTIEEVRQRLRDNPRVAVTDKRYANLIFSFGRDHGYYGRILSQTVVVSPTLAVRRKREVYGFCFTPQDGNSLLSSVAMTMRYLYPKEWEQKMQVFDQYLFKEV